jgi:NAD(P)-dependent dehydrogenase (short-subunit alcohol dehydrogenase family)
VISSKQKKIVAITSGIGSISAAGRIGSGPYFYRISKTALDMSMQALAQDVKKDSVVVAVISPTPSETDMLATFHNFYGQGGMKSSSPADSVAKAIPVIAAIDQTKAAQGIVVADGSVLPW